MDVIEAIKERRSYRSLESVKIDEGVIKELAKSASLSCSCYNNQPWRFIFVKGEEKLNELYEVLSGGNKWAKNSSMIIAVFSKKKLDCVVKERIYNLFDTGMSVGMMLLRATEMGLVAHPIAGFNESEAKKILKIPEDFRLITLIIVGKHSEEIRDELSEKQAEVEKERPERMDFKEFAWIDSYSG